MEFFVLWIGVLAFIGAAHVLSLVISEFIRGLKK